MPRLLELFSGTGSVGSAFEDNGWDVTSLDCDRKAGATITCDIRTWDYKAYPTGHFDVVWASPCCTHYSIARTRGGPRDLVWADSLVLKTLEIIDYFKSRIWWIENPQTGLLKTRPFMQGLPYFDIDYCTYGGEGYRKRTRLWTNAPFVSRALCDKKTCPFVENGRHLKTAQHGPQRYPEGLTKNDNQSLQTLHALPRRLCEDIAETCR
jgi:hypothetical protein